MEGKEAFDLYAFMEENFKDQFNFMFTSQPATIQSFNPEDNIVEVTLDKEGITLKDIPISLFGNPASYITTPTLEKGTKGLLIFSKHDLYTWVESGLDPHAKTDFSKNNAFFLIGVTNQKNKINYNLNAIEIKTDKAIELISANDTSITSNKNINFTSTLSTNINCKNLNATAENDIVFGSKNFNAIGSVAINVSAPKISLKCTSTGEELISLVKNISDDLKGLATALSQSKDQTYNLPLTNQAELATYINKFERLSTKLGGFS